MKYIKRWNVWHKQVLSFLLYFWYSQQNARNYCTNSLALNLFPLFKLRDAIDCCSLLYIVHMHSFYGCNNATSSLIFLIIIIIWFLESKYWYDRQTYQMCWILFCAFVIVVSPFFSVICLFLVDLLFQLFVWNTRNPFTFLGRGRSIYITHI